MLPGAQTPADVSAGALADQLGRKRPREALLLIGVQAELAVARLKPPEVTGSGPVLENVAGMPAGLFHQASGFGKAAHVFLGRRNAQYLL